MPNTQRHTKGAAAYSAEELGLITLTSTLPKVCVPHGLNELRSRGELDANHSRHHLLMPVPFAIALLLVANPDLIAERWRSRQIVESFSHSFEIGRLEHTRVT